MSVKRAKFIKQSNILTSELSSITPQTTNQDEEIRSRWKNLIKSKNYFRNNHNHKNSTICIIQ
jgi:hypothetical protein